MHRSSKRYTQDSDEGLRPTILVISPNMEVTNLIEEYLSEIECHILVAHDRASAWVALARRPALALVDVVQSRINCSGWSRNLKSALELELISEKECEDVAFQLLSAIWTAEDERAGVEIAREIRRRAGDIPVIFTSTDRTALRRLPFGQAFNLFDSIDELLSMVGEALQNHPAPAQATEGERAVIVDLASVRGDYVLAAA